MTRTEATILELPPRVRQRLAAEEVAWLTTITARDAPAPAPVWFVLDEGFLTVFSSPTTKKARNIRRRPLVTLHLNSDPKGSGIVVVTGRATVEDGVAPSSSRGYVEKYRPAILRRGLTVEEFDRVSSTRIRIRPLRVWLGGRRLADEVQREEGARDGADDSAT